MPGFYFLALAAKLSPDHQTPVLSRNTHRLAGGKAQLFQPLTFNRQLRAGVGPAAVGAVTATAH